MQQWIFQSKGVKLILWLVAGVQFSTLLHLGVLTPPQRPGTMVEGSKRNGPVPRRPLLPAKPARPAKPKYHPELGDLLPPPTGGLDELSESELVVDEATQKAADENWKESVCEGTTLDVDEIQIHIMAWKRPQSLYVLLEQLRTSSYDGWERQVPLFIHVDGSGDPLVTQVARAAIWPHGPRHADVRESFEGPREMCISSLRAAAESAGPNTLMIVFEDDMRVSSIFFQWVLLTIKAYARNRQCRSESLMGFSLSSIRLMDMKKPVTRWRAREAFPTSTVLNNAFLSAVPSSWGGAYWSDRWLEFDEFLSLRMKPGYYNVTTDATALLESTLPQSALTPRALHIPNAQSNAWPRSWKRFMVDFMYGCGFFMLYPNLQGEEALATTLALQGKHVRRNDKKSFFGARRDRRGLQGPVPSPCRLAAASGDFSAHPRRHAFARTSSAARHCVAADDVPVAGALVGGGGVEDGHGVRADNHRQPGVRALGPRVVRHGKNACLIVELRGVTTNRLGVAERRPAALF